MTEAFVQYGWPIPPESVCAACESRELLVRDHCHEHGWVRAVVCRSCNSYLGSIDRRLAPGVGEKLVAALLAVRNYCPDCEPIGVADLERRERREPRRRKRSDDPRMRRERVRRTAARKNYILVKLHNGPYELTSAKGLPLRPAGRPEVFASLDAVEEFLAH